MSSTPHSHLGESGRLLYDELIRREVPVTILDPTSSLLQYTANTGSRHLLFSTCSDKSSAIGHVIAASKVQTAVIAKQLGIIMPAQITSRDIRDVRKFLDAHKLLVIKPVLGSGGEGVSTNLNTTKAVERAYAYAKKYSHNIIAQQHVEGDDVRLLVIGGKFCSAVIRKPAHVIGDGVSSIKELVSAANATPLRNDATLSSLLHINPYAVSRFLGAAVKTVVPNGEEVRVVGPANVSLGGSLYQATHLVTPRMIADAEAITQALGLGICGVDMMWDRKDGQHYLIEVNATPGIDIHDDPFSGTSSDCVVRYVDWLLK